MVGCAEQQSSTHCHAVQSGRAAHIVSLLAPEAGGSRPGQSHAGVLACTEEDDHQALEKREATFRARTGSVKE